MLLATGMMMTTTMKQMMYGMTVMMPVALLVVKRRAGVITPLSSIETTIGTRLAWSALAEMCPVVVDALPTLSGAVLRRPTPARKPRISVATVLPEVVVVPPEPAAATGVIQTVRRAAAAAVEMVGLPTLFGVDETSRTVAVGPMIVEVAVTVTSWHLVTVKTVVMAVVLVTGVVSPAIAAP